MGKNLFEHLAHLDYISLEVEVDYHTFPILASLCFGQHRLTTHFIPMSPHDFGVKLIIV